MESIFDTFLTVCGWFINLGLVVALSRVAFSLMFPGHFSFKKEIKNFVTVLFAAGLLWILIFIMSEICSRFFDLYR